MKTILFIILTMFVLAPMAPMASTVQGSKYHHKSIRFDRHGCKRHIKAIARAAKDAGGEVKKNDGSERSYRITIDGITTIYTCTRHQLLETEL